MARGPDPQITAVDILEVFALSTEPAFVPAEIAEKLGVTKEGARHQMENLVERGYLRRKKPGERTVLYWITEAGVEFYAEETTSRSSA